MTWLSGFPRPKDDNGWGMHGSPSYAQPYAGTADDNWSYGKLLLWARKLHDRYGIRWFKFLANGSDGSIMFAKALVDAGIEPIPRLYAERPSPNWTVDSRVVAAYVAVGCHYFEYINEPNLADEWQGMSGTVVIGHQFVVATCNQIIRNTDEIVKGGGIALIPAMAPGDEKEDPNIVCYQSILLWFKNAILDDGTPAWTWFKQHCDARHIAIAIHNRMGNHVKVSSDGVVDLSYPEDPISLHGEPLSPKDAAWYGMDEGARQRMNNQRQRDKSPLKTLRDDPVGFRAYELIDDVFYQALGYHLPLIGTEAGPEPGDNWDGRYPSINPVTHSIISMEIFRRFNPSHPQAWRPALFAQCMWVWALWGHGAFLGSPWLNNPIWGSPYVDANLPAVNALEELARKENFVRVFAAQEPIVEVLYRVKDANNKQLIATLSPEKALRMAIDNRGYVIRLVKMQPDPVWPVIDFRTNRPVQNEDLRQLLLATSQERDHLKVIIDNVRRAVG